MTAHDKRVYNSRAWQRLRLVKLQETPLCEPCSALGRLVPATVVDHRMPIAAGGDAFPELDGLMAMCEACHNRKTNGEQRGNEFVMKGADVRGLPIDPNHSFFGNGDIPSDHKQLPTIDRPPRRAASKFAR